MARIKGAGLLAIKNSILQRSRSVIFSAMAEKQEIGSCICEMASLEMFMSAFDEAISDLARLQEKLNDEPDGDNQGPHPPHDSNRTKWGQGPYWNHAPEINFTEFLRL